MKSILHRFFLSLVYSTLLSSIFAIEKYAKVTLSKFQDNNQSFIIINAVNEEHWHTYWKNPGDAGLAWVFNFTGENSQDLSSLFNEKEWPAPHKFIEDEDIQAYGFEKEYSFIFSYNPTDLKKFNNQKIKLEAKFLICKDICLPGKENFEFEVKNGEPVLTVLAENDRKRALSEVPSKSTEHVNWAVYKNPNVHNKLLLAVSTEIKNLDQIKKFDQNKMNIIFPFPFKYFSYYKEKIKVDTDSNLAISLFEVDWEGDYQTPELKIENFDPKKKPIPLRLLGFDFKELKHKVLTFELNNILKLTPTLETYYSKLPTLSEFKKDLTLKNGSSNEQNSHSIFYFFLLAILGGIILNFMPCVLPVISLKLFGLVVHSDESNKNILKHNIAYTLGVLFSMLVLAFATISIKATGKLIGWGFQLQSPIFVFIMMFGIFLLTLNLFGLYEFRTPGGKTIGNTQLKKSFYSDFISGIIAVILSTPCSAPILGTAISFTFTTSNTNIVLIFFFVGIGLSFPFILTGLFPSLVKFLPKPGLWMETFKKFLGFSMLVTFIWLHDVFTHLINFDEVALIINTFFGLVFFSLYLNRHLSKVWVKRTIVVLPYVFLIFFYSNLKLNFYPIETGGQKVNSSSLNSEWMGWNEKEFRSQNELFFVDFTAKWCLTCKVNKKLVLDTEAFNDFAKKNNIKLMRGDWTKYNPEITSFLNGYGAYAVPAYFFKDAKGDIHFLGETISINKIKSYLK